MDKLKLIHLFSGVGAPEMALKRLGIPLEIVGYSEIDKYAIQSYQAIHNNYNSLGDIKQLDRLPKCNLLVYGSPCTDFSIAGLQKGLIDKNGNQTRSGLLLEVERLMDVAKSEGTQPEILLMENVKNLVGKNFKADFDRWLSKLDELGYNNYWQVLNAKDFGVPQNRERVFVVSIKKEIDRYGYKFPNKFELTKYIEDILEKDVDEKYYISQDKVECIIQSMSKDMRDKLLNNDIHTCYLTNQATNFEKESNVACTLMARDYKGFGNQRGNAVVTGAIRGRYTDNGKIEQKLEINNRGITNTITTVQKDNCIIEKTTQPLIIDDLYKSRDARKYANVAPTLRTNCGGFKVQNGEIRIRRITPKECWRLMDFTDEDFEKATASGVSNSQLYKQAGNSIVVNVLYHIFKRMFVG